MYTIRLLKPADRALGRLDKAVATRVVRRLRWLAENFELINPEPLKGRLQGSTSCVTATIGLLMKYYEMNG